MPAAVGIALAQRDRGRVIALIGDGLQHVQHPEPLSAAQLGAGRRRGAEQRWLRRHETPRRPLFGFAPGEKVVGIAVPGIRYMTSSRSRKAALASA